MLILCISVTLFIAGALAYLDWMSSNYQSKWLRRESAKNAFLGAGLMAAAIFLFAK